MTASLGRMWALALNTFREAARSRVLYGILVLVVGANLTAVTCGELSIHEQDRVARDFSLAGIALFGSLTAIVLGVLLLYTEVQKRTVHAIVSKPIERWEFVLGKYLGMLLTLAVLMTIMAVTLFLVLWFALSVFGGDNDNGTVLRAVLLVFGEIAVITAIAVLFSSFSSPILSGALTLGIFAVGHFTPELRELIAKVEEAPLRVLLRGGMRLFPDLHLFYVSGSMVGGQHVSVHGAYVDWSYVAMAGLYGTLYCAAAIALAMIVFSRRDFV